ncbi:MAG: nickel-dependent lactate racemase [Deltaproteobacteria bacterium]|nr:nickel-dependent lactate racemase [Deltaproteobacteria bacterium]
MSYYLNYEGGKLEFSLPPAWNVLTCQDCSATPVVDDVEKEIGRALDNPIGSLRVEELAKPGMDVVVLFDDVQRTTPAYLVFPPILDRLNRAGIPDERISGVCALGTHPALSPEQLEKKVGKEVIRRLQGRVFNHDPRSDDNILVGRTNRGTTVELNKLVAQADLILGIGECMPHPYSGFGGGCKIIMPGVSSYRAVAEHHYTWMRHRNSKLNLLQGNPFYEDLAEVGRMSRLAFKLDFIMNEKHQVIRAFAGDPVEEHRKASEYAASLYMISLPKRPDVVITSAAPLEIGVNAMKALLNASFAVRTGGTIIWVASQKNAGPIMPLVEQMATKETANEYHRRLLRGDIPDHLKNFGISFIMMVVIFKELSEKFTVIHVPEALTKEQVDMMNFTYASSLDEAVSATFAKMPTADVAIFPSGGASIPDIA